MDNSIRATHFSVPVVAYDTDSVICDENDLALKITNGVSSVGKPLVDFLSVLPETYTTRVLFEQNGFTILELTAIRNSGPISKGMKIEHELITPLDRMRSRLYKLKLQPEEQQFFEEIFVLMRKKVQSITLEMGFRNGDIPLNITRDCDLSKTLTNLTNAVNQYYNSDIVSLDLQDSFVFADYDENKLLHALLQLISNAVKMSGANTLPVITLSLSQSEKGTIIAVSDSGVGFSVEDTASLTEAYHQADNSFTSVVPGLGVGLYLVKEIVSMHQGVLELSNNESGGARVTITLPPRKRQTGKGRINSPPLQFSLEEVRDRVAFMLIDAPLNK